MTKKRAGSWVKKMLKQIKQEIAFKEQQRLAVEKYMEQEKPKP